MCSLLEHYIVLHLDFSAVELAPTLSEIEANFKSQFNQAIDALRIRYAPLLNSLPAVDLDAPVSLNLSTLTTHLAAQQEWPRLYIIIDEVDSQKAR